jgi:hypothetical protein
MNAVRKPKSERRETAGVSIKDRGKFNTEMFESIAKDLESGRIPLDRVTVTDDAQVGLRAIIRNTGLISFHVTYDVDGSRPYLKLGDHPAMSVTRARAVAKTVRGLADNGVDVQQGLHERLIRELEKDGMKWRP